MAQKLFVEVEETLRAFCSERSIPVGMVRFFGSRAVGDAAGADSDLDLLLVSEAFEGKDIFERTRMVSGLHRILVKRFKIPFDIVFCSKNEWQNSGSPLLSGLK